MLFRLPLAVWMPALCLAQAAEPVSTQKVLDELRAIRAAMEKVEQGQRALLALSRIQADAARMAALEAQQSRLAAREEGLQRQNTDANRLIQNPPMIQTADGAQPAPVGDAAALRSRLADTASALADLRRERQSLDDEIARIRNRIAAMEKLIDEALK